MSAEKPFEPSGPLGCRITIILGPVSSREIVRNRLIKRSGLACTSLQQNNKYSKGAYVFLSELVPLFTFSPV